MLQHPSAILDQTRRINIVFRRRMHRVPSDVVTSDDRPRRGVESSATAAVADELAGHGMIPESIIVAIENANGIAGACARPDATGPVGERQ
jgi:hypothetical protein